MCEYCTLAKCVVIVLCTVQSVKLSESTLIHNNTSLYIIIPHIVQTPPRENREVSEYTDTLHIVLMVSQQLNHKEERISHHIIVRINYTLRRYSKGICSFHCFSLVSIHLNMLTIARKQK